MSLVMWHVHPDDDGGDDGSDDNDDDDADNVSAQLITDNDGRLTIITKESTQRVQASLRHIQSSSRSGTHDFRNFVGTSMSKDTS